MSQADTIIFYSLDYSYINFEQSRFRILNYDKNFGKYIFLLAKNTVDEVIYAAIRTKKKVADLVIDRFRKRTKHARQSQQANRKPEGETKGETRRSLPIDFST
jgi:ERCC4-related helicase